MVMYDGGSCLAVLARVARSFLRRFSRNPHEVKELSHKIQVFKKTVFLSERTARGSLKAAAFLRN